MEHEATKVLERHLLSRGWRVAEKEKSQSGRENEEWLVEATWSPQEARFRLEFCIDWFPGGPAQIWKIEAHNADNVSAELSPAERLVLYLGGGWMDRCEGFVRALEHFRFKKPNQ